jgi:hypothetical protein
MEKLKLNTPLSIDEIDFRVQSINKGGYATVLAYKDARVDMKRLDDIYGAEFWQKKYELIDNHLFCSIGIWNKEIAQWIWKQDVGTESNTEKEKGEASDAFKRACFNLGIGRELYDYPMIQIKLNDNEFDKVTNKPTFSFQLKKWVWFSEFTNGKITKLSCKDNNGFIRFTFCEPTIQQPTIDIEGAKAKLIVVKTLNELKQVYESLPKLEMANAEVIALKDKLKATLK